MEGLGCDRAGLVLKEPWDWNSRFPENVRRFSFLCALRQQCTSDGCLAGRGTWGLGSGSQWPSETTNSMYQSGFSREARVCM